MARRNGARMLKFVVGFAGGVGLFSGAVAISNTYEDNAKFTALKNLTSRAFAATVSSPNETYSHSYRNGVQAPPVAPWDSNWDKRDPGSLVRNDQTDSKLSKEELKSLKPTATRHLFLIRHGHYFTDGVNDLQKKLTPKGCKQAHLTGQRLAELNHPYTIIYNSTMTRAIETANIIAKHLPQVPREECSMLREGAPILPEPPVNHWKPEMKQFYEDGARIEAAFRKYIHRADVDQEADSYDVLVCHANVIRYFVVRALQLPPEAWLRVSLHHGSITWLSIRPSGRVGLRALGDAGHMPPEELSVS